MEKLRIKKNDDVVVTRGRNRGAKGKVMLRNGSGILSRYSTTPACPRVAGKTAFYERRL